MVARHAIADRPGECAMTTPKTPVVFIHGLWLHATSWQPWTGLFEEAGYEATAPGWPGVPDTVAEAREHPERQAGQGTPQPARHDAPITPPAPPLRPGARLPPPR